MCNIQLCFLTWSIKLHNNDCEKGLKSMMVNREDANTGGEKTRTKARGVQVSLQSSRIFSFEEVDFGLRTVYIPT